MLTDLKDKKQVRDSTTPPLRKILKMYYLIDCTASSSSSSFHRVTYSKYESPGIFIETTS
jgi:hypothetical protein